MQYGLGFCFIPLGFFIESLLFSPKEPDLKLEKSGKEIFDSSNEFTSTQSNAIPTIPHINVLILTVIFTITTLLAATQDIAIQGWAFTLFAKEQLGF